MITSDHDIGGDELLTWDDLEQDTDASDEDDMLHIAWDVECYVPALDGSGLIRAIPVYGSTAAWIRRQEDQCRIDTADAICQPAVIR
jgi:hypothetical protein